MPDLNLLVIDVETADEQPASICQIGLAAFRNGKLAWTWGKLVNPETQFLPFHTRLHGIGQQDVAEAETWPSVRLQLGSLMTGAVVASHTEFDRKALLAADRRYGLLPFHTAKWIDTCCAARAAWPGLSSHRLTHLARRLRIRYRAHDACEDARCAGEVLMKAAAASEKVRAMLQV